MTLFKDYATYGEYSGFTAEIIMLDLRVLFQLPLGAKGNARATPSSETHLAPTGFLEELQIHILGADPTS